MEDRPDNTDRTRSVELATELTIAWLSNPSTRASAEDVASFLSGMKSSVDALVTAGVSSEPAADEQVRVGLVSKRRSLSSPDHIISMIDGKPYKTLRRHLSTHGLTPESYRERYALGADYPMVSRNYSESRRAMAKSMGLGRKHAAAR